jgi:hypothetical protein
MSRLICRNGHRVESGTYKKEIGKGRDEEEGGRKEERAVCGKGI